jgi:cupin fold WbuC family metalloprotein
MLQIHFGFFSPVRYFGANNDRKLEDVFLRIMPENFANLTFNSSSYLSFTILNGSALISNPNFFHKRLSSFPGAKYFYAKFEAFVGNLEVYNTGESPLIMHLVTNSLPVFSVTSSKGATSYEHNLSLEVKPSTLLAEGDRVLRIPPENDSVLGPIHVEYLSRHMQNFGNAQGRICCHRSDTSLIQEMFLYFKHRTTFPMMKHLDRSESLLIIDGSLEYDLRNQFDYSLIKINMKRFIYGDNSNSNPCYIWINKSTFHSPVITSKTILAKETTTGPFLSEKTVFFHDLGST